ncbi:hypothetical protein FF38_08298 [Lucilia cuprina]|uniref:lysozyme n=1 Tax=Lucilia cuprina TaxID=7375 RepID=A0A0L0C7U9_LUCCU|nr:hypothetical protein FF38_08298 [Lucilia cuprina]
MSTVTQWLYILALLIVSSCHLVESKVFERCELAKVFRQRHRLDLTEVAQWVCIAQHSSGFNTAAQASSPSGGSHGLFQISDVYWCSPPGKGAGCNLPCHKLRDDNLSDDLTCIKRIYEEHQRISGDGYTAWIAYQQYCKNNAASYIQDCFPGERTQTTYLTSAKGYNSYNSKFSGNAIQDYSAKKTGKVYGRCELAQELYQKHKMPMEQIPTWVCIAEHESRFNTAAVGRLNADGSADHGLFQISDLYWCSNDRGGKGCGLSCSKLLDNDITDDVRCIKRIHNEHTAISGDGFNAWAVYRPYCQNQRVEQIAKCFKNPPQITHHRVQTTTAVGLATNQVQSATKYTFNNNNPFLKNVIQQKPSKTHYATSTYNDIYKAPPQSSSSAHRGVSHKGKIYTRCSLAQELFSKHNFPLQDIATWVCIAEHESQFNTAAIGRLNTDGSADHGLFQISDKYWCEHSAYGGKACNLPCDKLLDDDLRDDVACIKTIHEEHTRISGDGFNAWTVYKPHCLNQNVEHIKTCFDEKTLAEADVMASAPSYNAPVSKGKGKIYSKCELAQELYQKHQMPIEQIPKWVCIAQHESSYNTAAVGRLNTDGSADHGLFQISDLYWCSHEQYGGKACNIPCHKLLDSDITDDVRCIKIIHEEHTRISGDGFNAWTVYQPHCRNIGMDHIKQCFTEQELKKVSSKVPSYNTNSLVPQSSGGSKPTVKGKIYEKCELAQELYHKHRMPMEQIPKWVCIAQHESSYNTAAVGRLNTDGSADHGLFQISDLYWCTHDQYGGKACNIPCDKLLDSDITDDVRCIKIIHEEHTRISGDGFNAWTVYKPHCRNIAISHVKECFTEKELNSVQTSVTTNALIPQPSFVSKPAPKGKIYKKCELAQELYHKHRMPMEQIPKWVCIAQHESSYNTAAVGRLNTDGSADHGLFQISDLYWCTHDQYGGKACNIPCDKLLDSDITDDVRCIKIIHEEHTRISGDGFNAWTVYKPHCRNIAISHVKECFTEKELNSVQTSVTTNALIPQTSFDSKPAPKGKIYKKCELAQELYHKHRMPMEQIPKWVCIAQHESSYNTAAVGRLNTDGSADHGLFQISDLYWCTHDQYGGKACNIPCDKLLDSDITDDVRCIKIIHEEHTRISGDGFNAWTVYKPHCRNTGMSHIKDCFTEKELKDANIPSTNSIDTPYTQTTKNVGKGKIYKKCELAQELLSKHKMPMEQIPTWVCIAQHESSFNTAAVGRLNADGSLDHGLFQISDLYWCSHDQYGGKACNIPCDKLLDSDITDDVKCIKIIHEEHTRISGDGFNAWTVYKPHCRNRKMEEIRSCFTPNQIEEFDKKTTFANKPNKIQSSAASTSYSHNPFLSGAFKTQPVQTTRKPASNQNSQFSIDNKPNYANNPFLQNIKVSSGSEVHKAVVASSFTNQQLEVTAKPNYKDNPFLNGAFSSSNSNNFITKPVELINELDSFKTNPFLSGSLILSATVKPTQSSVQNNPFLQTTPSYKPEITKNYLNSNDFRTTTTVKPKTTAAKPSTTTKKPTTSWNSYTTIKTTTKKPATTTTRKTTATKKPTTSWNSYSTTKPTTTTTRKTITQKATAQRTTTTKKTAITTTTRRPTTTTTAKKPTTTSWTTKSPKTATTWSWQNQKSTSKVPKSSTTWSWQNQKYISSTTAKPARTTWSWQNQKYTHNNTLSQATTNLNIFKEQATRTTTIKPERTTWNWRNEQKSTTLKPKTTTENWRKWDKTTNKSTTKKPSATTTTRKITTKATTTKPTTFKTTKTTTTKPTTARTTKRLENYKNTTTKPQVTSPNYTTNNLKTTTLRPRSTTVRSALQKTFLTTTTTTTTRKPLTTKSQNNVDYNKFKNDPFSHPFFAKVNEQFKQLQGNITTTKRPTFAATKLQNFSQSSLYQDFKNNTLNKTKTIVAYNFEGSKLTTTTKRPRF